MRAKRYKIQAARLALDGLIALAAFWGVCASLIYQPLEWWVESDLGRSILGLGLIYAGSMVAALAVARVQNFVWHVVSARDVGRLIRTTAVGALLFLCIAFLTSRAVELPRSVLMIAWPLTAGGMAAARLMVRAKAEGWLLDVLAPFRMRREQDAKAMVVLVGPSVRVQRALFDIRDTNAPYRPIGVVLEDLPARNSLIGARVLGSTQELVNVVETLAHRDLLKFSLVFVVPPTSLDGIDESVMAKLRRRGTPILRMPKITELTEQDRTSLHFRPIRLEELLSRPPVQLSDLGFVQGVRGKRILVTGAGGSIGSELCRQIAALGCGRLIMLDIAETPLFEIDREIAGNYPSMARRAILADVRNAAAVEAVIAEERPDRIFHAAALKHVSLMETHPREAVLTNVVGTANVARCAREYGVEQMVLLSTDKAVNPSSVMGATKRLAEALAPFVNAEGKTHFSVVRFGNVLNSNGSAVPIFRRQIAAGGPVTVTHPEVERFFMTIPEAVQLVLHAADVAETRDGGNPGVYVLEMGEPVKIIDMARRMIELLAPPGLEKPVGIKLIGLQPGEKLSEELVDSNEETIYSTEGVLEVRSRQPVQLSLKDAEALGRFAQANDAETVRARLFEEVARIRGVAPPPPPVRLHLLRADRSA